MTTFIFDVDNTLTPPRQKILEEHIEIFKKFILLKNVYLVSGSDYKKLSFQLPNSILKNISGVFTCLGNCFYVNETLIYENFFEELQNKYLRSDINEYIKNSQTPIKTSNHIEERTGMLNISTIGRDATLEERKIYSEYDKVSGERNSFANFLRQKYPMLDVSIGGEISIDISVKGFNKAQALTHIPEKNNIVFFGDRCDNEGNDQPLSTAILRNNGVVYPVLGYKDTFKILQKLIKLEENG